MNQLLDGTRDGHLVYADWLDECGDEHAANWRSGRLATYAGYWVFDLDGIGSGSGIGSGRGRGSGIGIGIGRGSGIVIGSGIGSGRGRGRGRGSGIGRGRGSGIGRETLSGNQMKVGENYLIHCGDWHTFVGRYVGPSESGPLLYRFEDVAKIRETNNGDCWGELAAGDESLRDAMDCAFYGTEVELPVSIAAIHWVGDLPKRSDR